MARLLTGISRARTVTHRPAPARDAVTAPPRPAVVPEPDVDAPGADRGSTDGGVTGVDETRADDTGADPGSGGGRFDRFLPGGRGGDRSGFDVRNSWQVVAGSFLVPAGVVIILIAWYGAAHTRYVQQQIPYLVSGSFIGLGCMILGGLLYWAHWLYRLYDQADLNHEEMLKAFEQTLRVVADRLTGGAGSPAGAPGSPAPAVPGDGSPTAVALGGRVPDPGSGAFVATATGSVYHLPSCPVVAHHGDGLRALGPDDLAGLEPCRICLAPRRPLREV